MPSLTSWTAAWGALVPDANPGPSRGPGRTCSRGMPSPTAAITAVHVDEMVAALDRLVGEPTDRALGALVAWFHDAVYDPMRGDNEAASAQIARGERGAGVNRGIRTAGRRPRPGDRGSRAAGESAHTAAVHDADLWIFAASAARFDEYCAQVRAEFAHVPGGRMPRAAPRSSPPRGVVLGSMPATSPTGPGPAPPGPTWPANSPASGCASRWLTSGRHHEWA